MERQTATQRDGRNAYAWASWITFVVFVAYVTGGLPVLDVLFENELHSAAAFYVWLALAIGFWMTEDIEAAFGKLRRREHYLTGLAGLVFPVGGFIYLLSVRGLAQGAKEFVLLVLKVVFVIFAYAALTSVLSWLYETVA